MANLTIRHCNEHDLNRQTTEHLAELVNSVYGTAEADLWKPETSRRTSAVDIKNHIIENQLLIAELSSEIVGMCKIGNQDNEICEFGMLVADPVHRSKGIGRELVKAAESWGRKTGYKTMRLELLTPRHWKNDSKEFLKIWYTRLGYTPSYTVPFEEEFTHRKDDFATDCDFTVWLKDLN